MAVFPGAESFREEIRAFRAASGGEAAEAAPPAADGRVPLAPHPQQGRLALSPEEIDGVFSQVCSEATTPAGALEGALQVSVKLLVDMWDAHRWKSFPLAASMLRKVLSSASATVRARAFDLAFNLSVRARALGDAAMEVWVCGLVNLCVVALLVEAEEAAGVWKAALAVFQHLLVREAVLAAMVPTVDPRVALTALDLSVAYNWDAEAQAHLVALLALRLRAPPPAKDPADGFRRALRALERPDGPAAGGTGPLDAGAVACVGGVPALLYLYGWLDQAAPREAMFRLVVEAASAADAGAAAGRDAAELAGPLLAAGVAERAYEAAAALDGEVAGAEVDERLRPVAESLERELRAAGAAFDRFLVRHGLDLPQLVATARSPAADGDGSCWGTLLALSDAHIGVDRCFAERAAARILVELARAGSIPPPVRETAPTHAQHYVRELCDSGLLKQRVFVGVVERAVKALAAGGKAPPACTSVVSTAMEWLLAAETVSLLCVYRVAKLLISLLVGGSPRWDAAAAASAFLEGDIALPKQKLVLVPASVLYRPLQVMAPEAPSPPDRTFSDALAALLLMVGGKLGEAPVLDDYVVTNLLPELLKSADSQVCCLASQLLLEAWKRQNPSEAFERRLEEMKEELGWQDARTENPFFRINFFLMRDREEMA